MLEKTSFGGYQWEQVDDSGSVLAMSKCRSHVQVEGLSSC